MKRIWELTKDEVLHLTNSEIDRLIDLECAIEGVPLLPPCPVEPKKPKIEPNITAYEIAGLHFLIPEEAIRVQEAIQAGTPYGYAYVAGYSQKRLTSCLDSNQLTIYPVKMYTTEYWEEVKSQITEYNNLMEQYKSLKIQYDEIVAQRNAISNTVWARINKIWEENQKMIQLENEFRRYLELADNNATIAMRFLLRAYPNAATEFPEIIKTLAPDYKEEGSND